MMINQQTPQSKKIDAQMQAYEKLPRLQQRVLQLKALLYDSSNKNDFYHCIVSLLSEPAQKKMSYAALNTILDALVRAKWLDKKYNCHRSLLHRMAALAVDTKNPERAANLALIKRYPGYKDVPSLTSTTYLSLTDVRAMHLAVHCNEDTLFNQPSAEPLYYHAALALLETVFLESPIDFEWLQGRKPCIQWYLVIVKLLLPKDAKIPADFMSWRAFYASCKEAKLPEPMQYLKAQMDIRFGLLMTAQKQLLNQSAASPYCAATQGTLHFLAGQGEAASQHYEIALKSFKKCYDKRFWFMEDVHGLFCILLQLCQKKLARIKNALFWVTTDMIKSTEFQYNQHLCLMLFKKLEIVLSGLFKSLKPQHVQPVWMRFFSEYFSR